MNDNESALIIKVVNLDDHQAFATLVKLNQQTVRQWLFRLTKGDQSLSDDLAQETFLKAYQSLKQFKQTVQFSTWLYRIAYHIFIDYQRRFNKHWLEFSDLDIEEIHDIKPYSVHEAQLEQHHDIAYALSKLSQSEQVLIQMHYYFELSHEDIHYISELPLGTVKSKLRRSLIKLKALLSEDQSQRVAI